LDEPRCGPAHAAVALDLLGLAAFLAGLSLIVRLDPGPASSLRHLYLAPVLLAALRLGALGGALAALGAVLLEAPRLFAHLEDTGITALVVDDLISDVTLLVLGPLVGSLAAAARRQQARSETLLALQRTLAEEERLPVALERLRALLGARLGCSALALAVRAGEGLVVAGGTRVAPGSAAARVLETGAPIFAADVAGRGRVRRALVVPLLARGESIGVLALEREGELGRRDRAGLGRLGGYLGLALENARLAAEQRRFSEALAEKVAAATRHLAEVDRAKSAFVATASHELRTPLTALVGFSDLLARRPFAPDEVRRMAILVRDETERLARIVDDLLDLTRLEQGLAPRLRPAPVAVAPALAAAVAVFQPGGARPRVVLACDDALPRVRADPDALDRIVKNLVSNALKYSPAGRPVTVGAHVAGGRVEITVADEGRGIPAEALPHIFEPYYRAPEAVTAARGTGLGLAVVKALVDAQAGTIDVESAPGLGTRVTVRLPAVRRAGQSRA
jgi:signal transduction histidine kinase